MKVLKLNEKVLSFLDFFSFEVFERPTNKYLKYLNPYALLISQCVFSVSSVVFLMISSGHLSDWMMALAQTIFVSAITGAFICLALQMENSETMHEKLQDIVDDAKETEAFEIYEKTERKCEMWTKWTLTLTGGAEMTALTLPSFIHSLVYMWHENYDTSTWFLFVKLAIPFDSSNIFVWYGLMIAEALMGTICVLIFTSMITYSMSCSFYVDACVQHFRFVYRQIEEKIDASPRKTYENIPEIKRRLTKAISLHVKIIGVVNLVADIMGGVLFSLMFPCFFCLAIFLYFLDKNLSQMNFTLFFIQMYGSAVFLVAFPFILCYFETNITHNMLSIADVAYNDISWYRLPPNLRRYVLLIIQRAQEPMYITGFKLVDCTLYNFAMCMKSAYSYYMVIPTLAKR